MHRLVHQVVVPWTLPDNPEVVHEGEIRLAILERTAKALLCNASRLVLETGGLAGPSGVDPDFETTS